VKTLAASVACVLVAIAPGTAPAAHVGCGAVVTQDTTLDSDLVDCPANGVHIAGSGVTLDLAGHTIDGAGGAFGVVTTGRSFGVTVTGGRVRGFHIAVAGEGGGQFVARDLEVSGSHNGIRLGTTSAVVARVLAWGNDGSGLNMSGSRNVLVIDSVMVANGAGVSAPAVGSSRLERNFFGWNTFHGLRGAGMSDSVLLGNRVHANGTVGIRLEEGSSGNVLSGNRVSGSGTDGIMLAEDSGDNRLERNRSVRNGADGFDLAGAGATLVRNRADRNAGLGFDAPLGVAIDVRNAARHNGDSRQCVGVDCRPGRP
jgi:parallel beta-helix repeat protein